MFAFWVNVDYFPQKLEKEYFLAPDLSQYTSRRSAYQALIKQAIPIYQPFKAKNRCFEQGASETELALMREGLVACSAFGQNWGVGISFGENRGQL